MPSNGTCFSCQDPHCSSCQSDGVTCLICMSGYNLNSAGKCSSVCTSGLCSVCNPTNPKICSVCIPGYYVNLTSNICIQCSGAPACTQCIQTSPDICILCATGFYLNSNNTCVSCPSYCASCSSSTSCQILKQTLGQVLTTVNDQTVLATCDVGCLTCSTLSPLSCATCYPGYYLAAPGFILPAYCQPCQNNCMTCDNSLSNCLSCYPDWALNNGACTPCSSSCLTCSSSNASVCTSCAVGSVLYLNGTCQALSQISGTCSLGCNSCI